MHGGIQAGATNISNSSPSDESDNEPGISRKSSDSGIDSPKLCLSDTDQATLPDEICDLLRSYSQYLNADYAKENNSPHTLKELIVNARYGDDEDSLLHTLIDKNATEEAINFLIEQGIDINLQNKYGVTPLHLAVKKENIALTRSLVNAGANTNVFNRSCYGATPLHIATANGNLEIVKILIEQGNADINSSHKSERFQGPSPIHSAIVCANDKYPKRKQGCLKVTKYLIKQPQFEVNAQDHDGKTALHYAVQDGNIDVVKLLLTAQNINPFIKDNEGKTPFDYAREKREVLEALIKAQYRYGDAKINFFHLAVKNNHIDVVKYLIEEQKLEVDFVDCQSSTPLHVAAMEGHVDIVNYLIVKGADVNHMSRFGHTAMILATSCILDNEQNCLQVIKSLVKNKADINLVYRNEESFNQQSALHFAVQHFIINNNQDSLDIILYLLSQPKLNINIKDGFGKTVSHCAQGPILDVLNIRCNYDEQISRCNKKSSTFGCLALLVANFLLIGLYVRSNFLQEAVINITQDSHYIYAAFMLGVSILIGAGFIRHNYITKKSIEKDFNHQILNTPLKDKSDNRIDVEATLSDTKVENDLVESQLIT